MNKDGIKQFKKSIANDIKDKAEIDRLNYIYFNRKRYYDKCFARVFRQIRELSHTFESFQYLIAFSKDTEVFDNDALHKQLNEIFGEYFKITRNLSGRKAARILDVELKMKVYHWKMWWIPLYIMACMLRLTDEIYKTEWLQYFARNPRQPINNWQELIYIFHHHIHVNYKGYELNDKLTALGQSIPLKRTELTRENAEKKMRVVCDNYIDTLFTVFGKKFTFTKDMKLSMDMLEERYITQTRAFDAVTNLVALGEK